MKDNNKFNSEYFDSSDAHFYPKVKEECKAGLYVDNLFCKASVLANNVVDDIECIYIQLRVDDMKKGNEAFFDTELKKYSDQVCANEIKKLKSKRLRNISYGSKDVQITLYKLYLEDLNNFGKENRFHKSNELLLSELDLAQNEIDNLEK